MRTDIIKIGTMQRPVPQTVRDLGEWEKCLWLQNYLAVLQARAAPSLSLPLSLSLRSPPFHPPTTPLLISNHLESTSVHSIPVPTAQNSRAICSAAPPPIIAATRRCCAAAALRR